MSTPAEPIERWILDTSAWARRDVPAVARTLRDLARREDVELVLSPAVLLKLLRGPQGEAVAAERAELEQAFVILAPDEATFAFAATAMERLALIGPDAHRLPIADLVTAALAHQHHAGVLHLDADFERIAAGGGLRFETRRVCEPDELSSAEHPVASEQRRLRRELLALLHRRPVAEAEAFLRRAVDELSGP